MPQLTQKNKTVGIESPLGEDVLILNTLSGTERLGRPFAYELKLVSERPDEVKFDSIVGHNLTVRVEQQDGQTRYFNGYVSRFSQVRWDGLLTHYRATLVPWLWFLTRWADCRIFQEMTVPDIVKQVFRDHGFSDFDEALTGTYRTWEYCVQYRETAFAFVSRLMEMEGIYYFFTHENGKHTLVLADSISAHQPIADQAQVGYHPPSDQRLGQPCIYEWRWHQRVQPTTYALNSFDYLVPNKALAVRKTIQRQHAEADGAIYDYPGPYAEFADGENYSQVRIEELQTQFEQAQGESDVRGMSCGSTFKLSDFPVEDQNKEYLITEANCRVQSDLNLDIEEGGTAGGASEPGPSRLFTCRFKAIDSTQPFRPKRQTRKPTIQGPQTAFVVGQSGEEIYTDQHGRIKVQFHWDRYGQADENSSCWVRVAQSWAGKKWGAVTIPRVGQEVMVEFLEGDPDRPIVTGRVYNGEAKPPYKLPENKTISTLKSYSSKGGQGFNEIRFEDKKGEEQVFIHAQKKMETRVLNDQLTWVGNEQHLIVKTDRMEQIDGDQHLSVKGDQNDKIDGARSVETGADLMIKVGGSHGMEATSDIHLKASSNVVIEAASKITLKCGGSFVTVEPSGVYLSGPMVGINDGGSAGSGPGCSPDPPKLPTEADDAKPGEATTISPGAQVLQQAAENGTPFCEQCEAAKQNSQSSSGGNT